MKILLFRVSTFRWSILIFMCLLLLVACPGVPEEPNLAEEAVFRIEACEDQHFQALIRDPKVIEEAERLIGVEQQRIINGKLRRGDGGFNSPWSWHMDPQAVDFVDMTIGLCDSCPHMVEENLDYWIDTVGRFCPWSTRVVERLR